MTNPFRIEGPAVISFSGGRTSALMLWRIMEAYDGKLPPDVHVLFADTGKERQETYDFVKECGDRWGVWIRWVHRCTLTYWDASVCFCLYDGAPTPFEMLIIERNFLPNPVSRFCTQELKIRPMKEWMTAHGYDHWTNIVGLRADEPHRVARIQAREGERYDVACPLSTARITVDDVDRFWIAAPFDLRLRKWEGNCDICFLKGINRRRRIMVDHPEMAQWWIRMEAAMGGTFRKDAPPYARLLEQTQQQLSLFVLPSNPAPDDDDLGACECTD